ncbi:hypothetical protein DIE00_30810 [Burkholderia sp. Bp8989]|nr:hypothetical protein DIE05_21630 [Burkholderia sp. Bp8995]RQS40604.1 hypothetical protein DIE00_30810 [Burkholderia sp. Bp8989]
MRTAIRHPSRSLNDLPKVEQPARAVGMHESACLAHFAGNLGPTIFESTRYERLRIARSQPDWIRRRPPLRHALTTIA